MIKGSCLCGKVTYRVDEKFSVIECCHCLVCRKSHASAFSMGVTISAESFVILTGNELLTQFESSANKKRVFCSVCGSQLYAYNPEDSDFIRLRPALLDVDLNQFEYKHIYTDYKICKT